MDEIRCEHCGGICEDEDDLQVLHRGCRLKALFPDACTEDGPVLKFDVKKIKEQLDAKK